MTTTAQGISRTPKADSNWALLERIAASVHLKRAPRLQELLFYIGKCSIREGYEKISEQKIGVDVFARPEGYDTSADNIVRTSVSELRKRIEAYFELEGRNESVVVEIPRWSYIPVFTPRRPEERSLAEHLVNDAPHAIEDDHHSPQIIEHPRPLAFVSWALAALILVLAGTSIFFWTRNRALEQAIYPWKSEPSVAELWNQIFNSSPETDIVLADASFGMLQDINKKSFTFEEYLNRSYMSQLQGEKLSPEMRDAFDRIALWNLGSQDDFKLAQRILALDPLGNRVHMYNARAYLPDLTQRDNVILIGARISNPWDDLFESRMNFVVRLDGNRSITVLNRAPSAGEQQVYQQSDASQYCVVAYLPNPSHNGVILMVEGSNAEATEAAGNFLLSEVQLSNFKKVLKVNQLPYFEVLLKVSSVPGTPLSASIEAYRAYPNLR
jgi:hypothetical protein